MVIVRDESSTVWKWVPSVVLAPAAAVTVTLTGFCGSAVCRAAATVIFFVPPSSATVAGDTLSAA